MHTSTPSSNDPTSQQNQLINTRDYKTITATLLALSVGLAGYQDVDDET